MSERLTDEQLREMAGGEYGGSRRIAPIAAELLALRAENERLREALVAVDVMRGKLFISGAGVIASIDVWKVYRDAALAGPTS